MHGYDNVDPGKEDRPGERTLQDWAQLGRWLMCDAFIAFEQQPGADRGMVQLCRDVHQQLQAALVAARPEDGLPLLENGMGGLVAAAPPGLCEMLAELSAVVKVAGNLTQEQLAAVETMHAWLKSECLLVRRPIRRNAYWLHACTGRLGCATARVPTWRWQIRFVCGAAPQFGTAKL